MTPPRRPALSGRGGTVFDGIKADWVAGRRSPARPAPRPRSARLRPASEPEPEPSTDVWAPPAAVVAPASGRLELVYGYDRDRSPIVDALGCGLVAGDRGAGKSAYLAFLGQQADRLGARLVLVDVHARVAESLTRRLGRDPDQVAADQVGAYRLIARVRILMDRRLSGADPDRSPVVLVVDEYPSISYPPTHEARTAVADLMRIAQEGRKAEVHVWIGTSSTAGDGSGLPRNLRDALGVRIILRLANSAAQHVVGRPLGDLPASPATLTHGRALVLVPNRAEYLFGWLPLPSPDGSVGGPPADLPDEDPALMALERTRGLQLARGPVLARFDRALADLQGIDGMDDIREALLGGRRAAREAHDVGQLRRVEQVYAADLAAAGVEEEEELADDGEERGDVVQLPPVVRVRAQHEATARAEEARRRRAYLEVLVPVFGLPPFSRVGPDAYAGKHLPGDPGCGPAHWEHGQAGSCGVCGAWWRRGEDGEWAPEGGWPAYWEAIDRVEAGSAGPRLSLLGGA